MLKSPDRIDYAKGFIHDVLVIAVPNLTPTRPLKYKGTAYAYKYLSTAYKQACEAFYKMLLERKCNTVSFSDYENIIGTLSRGFYYCRFHETNEIVSDTASNKEIYQYITWFCRNAKRPLFWDDTKITAIEQDQIYQTDLGQQLYKDKLFVSQQKVIKPTKTSTQKQQQTQQQTTGQNTSPQQSIYKARGPLSGAAIDLISQQNQKEILSGNIYCILGEDSTGKVLEDCAYIRPVENTQTNINKYSTADPNDGHITNKVLFGKAKGNGYCCCYFDNLTDANSFMNKVAQTVNIPSGIAKISVYKKKAQPNGYFKIGTEFGPCYISAAKLNEDLEVDALTEDLNKEFQEKFEAFKRYDDIFMKFN